jgi:hypothetical protein
MFPTLSLGSRSPDVKRLETILAAEGFFTYPPDDVFSEYTFEAVKLFQTKHIGPDGQYLEPDGIVGPKTWWALEHPTGADQKNNLQFVYTDGLTPLRNKVIQLARAEYLKNVHEIPNGSNLSPDIRRYGGRGGPWCCTFTTYIFRSAGVIGFQEASTWAFWKLAEKRGWFYPINSTDPKAFIPGNSFLWQHKTALGGHWTRTGHISIIVGANPNGWLFYTIGGNEGNRVKLGSRDIRHSADLIGIINPFPPDEQPLDFKRIVINKAGNVEGPRYARPDSPVG